MNGPTQQQLDAAWYAFLRQVPTTAKDAWYSSVRPEFYQNMSIYYKAMETVTCVH